MKIQVAEPVRINEPTTATSTVTSEIDLAGVEMSFYSDSQLLLIEDKARQNWLKGTSSESIDTKANRPASVARRFIIPKEGRYYLIASAMVSGTRVEDWVYIIATAASTTVYKAGDPVPTPPFQRALTMTPGKLLTGPLTPTVVSTVGPRASGSVTPVIPTAQPPTPGAPRLVPSTPTRPAYP